MADSTVGSGVFSTCPEFNLSPLGKAAGRLSFLGEVNGTEAPTHSIIREVAYLSGDGPCRIFPWFSVIICPEKGRIG
jgi:hypothetical protein